MARFIKFDFRNIGKKMVRKTRVVPSIFNDEFIRLKYYQRRALVPLTEEMKGRLVEVPEKNVEYIRISNKYFEDGIVKIEEEPQYEYRNYWVPSEEDIWYPSGRRVFVGTKKHWVLTQKGYNYFYGYVYNTSV